MHWLASQSTLPIDYSRLSTCLAPTVKFIYTTVKFMSLKNMVGALGTFTAHLGVSHGLAHGRSKLVITDCDFVFCVTDTITSAPPGRARAPFRITPVSGSLRRRSQ